MKFGYAVFGFTAVVQAQASACPDQLRSVLVILFRSLAEKPETGPGDYLICDRSWNVQLYLRAGSEFTPDRQFRSDLFGALVDSWQAPVPGTSAVFNHAWVCHCTFRTPSKRSKPKSVPSQR